MGEIEQRLPINFLKLSYDIFLFLSSKVLIMAYILSFSWPFVQMEKQQANSLKSNPYFLFALYSSKILETKKGAIYRIV